VYSGSASRSIHGSRIFRIHILALKVVGIRRKQPINAQDGLWAWYGRLERARAGVDKHPTW